MQTFDKVTVLYEGRQIFFGDLDTAKNYFIDLGFECQERQSTADFLTSVTNPAERKIAPIFRGKTPNTADEFATAWKSSEDRRLLLLDIDDFNHKFPLGGPSLGEFKSARKALQSKSQQVTT